MYAIKRDLLGFIRKIACKKCCVQKNQGPDSEDGPFKLFSKKILWLIEVMYALPIYGIF